MREQSILIVHPDRKTQRVIQRILGVTGYRVDIADDLVQAIRLIEHHGVAAVGDDHQPRVRQQRSKLAPVGRAVDVVFRAPD